MTKNVTLAFLTCLALSVTPAFAADEKMQMEPAPAAAADQATTHQAIRPTSRTNYNAIATKTGNRREDLYGAVRETMHHDMMVRPSGDADVDFVNNMLPHHKGAVDMAKIELANGKDEDLRKLAQSIIDAQNKEIAFMQAWLDKKKNSPADK